VVRVSGPRAQDLAAAVVRPWPIPPRCARLCRAVDSDGHVLDRPVVTVYDGARSYTGEPVVELSSHGGAVVPASIVAAFVAAGAREALPGEFTRRALLNGKLDLAQAEAVADLIDARTPAMQRAALAQLDGGLSRRVDTLRDALVGVEALVAYDIDFPEEDDGPVPRGRVAEAAALAANGLARLAATADIGECVRDGAVTVIAGPPNAGKSSLFNALLGRARALVTDVPGTTRDAIEAVVEPPDAPFPLRLVDTAGLREGAESVEQLGIELSVRYVEAAHAVLACADSAAGLLSTVRTVQSLSAAPIVAVQTKADLTYTKKIVDCYPKPDFALPPGVRAVTVSAESGVGLRQLLGLVVDAVTERFGGVDPESPVVTRARHREALGRAVTELALFQEAWRSRSVPAIVAAVHLRSAVGALDEIVGAIGVEDVLERVFREFCVGK
jgi:tRNA modification GTPase